MFLNVCLVDISLWLDSSDVMSFLGCYIGKHTITDQSVFYFPHGIVTISSSNKYTICEETTWKYAASHQTSLLDLESIDNVSRNQSFPW